MPPRKTPAPRAPRARATRKTTAVRKGDRSGARSTATKSTRSRRLAAVEIEELTSMRQEIERLSKQAPPRWNADPDDVRRSVAKLVLTLVEFIRQLLERQAIRRMDAGTLTAGETEAVGLALMRLEETVRDLAAQFGLGPDELNLDLGPVGRLM